MALFRDEWTPEGVEEGIVARDVSLEEYMERYAIFHCESVEGVVIRVSPSEIKHTNLIYYLYLIIRAFFDFRPIGTVVGQPFVMRLPAFPKRFREPDLLVVLETNPYELKDTYMDGPADLCIEVVSEKSGARDHGEKFEEYEKGGVGEYWILDLLHQEARFYRLDDKRLYVLQSVDSGASYRTPILPGLALHVPTLWKDKLPGPAAIVDMVKKMLENQS
jgi:Uma2 family endonuclease